MPSPRSSGPPRRSRFRAESLQAGCHKSQERNRLGWMHSFLPTLESSRRGEGFGSRHARGSAEARRGPHRPAPRRGERRRRRPGDAPPTAGMLARFAWPTSRGRSAGAALAGVERDRSRAHNLSESRMKSQRSKAPTREPSRARSRGTQVGDGEAGSHVRPGGPGARPAVAPRRTSAARRSPPARTRPGPRLPGPRRLDRGTPGVGLPLPCRLVMPDGCPAGSAAGNFDASSASRRRFPAANRLARARFRAATGCRISPLRRALRQGASSITRTPSGGTNSNSESGGSESKRISRNFTLTTFPSRSTTRVVRTSPLSGATTRKSFS